MGFYIEELPTELNGITMQEADYLADEFLSETPCNRMWDAMRALRDFYETVISEAIEVVDRKTENSSEIPNSCEQKRGCDADCNEDCTECAKEWRDWKDQMWTEAVTDEPQTERSE